MKSTATKGHTMQTQEQLIAQARRLTASRSTDQLILDFEVTDSVMEGLSADDHMNLAMARGWIMDELEARNPAAFEAWLETPEMTIADLRACFA
jgi:hypothetical protein